MIWIFFKGFSIGAGLIIAIGAQNAFVLNQGVRRNYIFVVPFICALSDALLILLGVTGLGAFIASHQMIRQVAAIGGAGYLFWIGFNSFRAAYQGSKLVADNSGNHQLFHTVLATLGVTYLNPHVYLDTVVFMGSISAQFNIIERYYFAAGAIASSFIWFFSLSVGGRLLSPVLSKPLAWRILDTTIGVIMWIIGFSLIRTL